MNQPQETPSAVLHDAAVAWRVEWRDECASSNTELLNELARDGGAALHGRVLVCACQTAGRGQRGRSWLSDQGASLTFSLGWQFPRGTPLSGLSLAAGLALAEALAACGAPDVALKWPNDLLLGRRKLGGILIEAREAVAGPCVVTGVGLNLASSRAIADVLPESAALSEAMARVPDRPVLLASLLEGVADKYTAFSAAGFAPLRAAWLARHAYQDAAVRLVGGDGEVGGTCRGVDESGALLVETEQGVSRHHVGEVSLRAARGCA